jgi:hypothetical protein
MEIENVQPSRKRGRPLSAKQKAMFASMREQKQWPIQQFGRTHHQRGSAVNISNFGPTWKQANADQRALRKATGYTGRGSYRGHGGFWDDLSNAESFGNRFVTKGIPNLLRAGGAIKKFFGGGLYTGHGDYHHSNNLVTLGATQNAVPSFVSEGDETGAITITHTEFITDIYGPPAASPFNNQVYSLNPALQQSFPWLSQIACNFEEYEFQQLMYTYRSVTTDIGSSTTGQCGTVIMSTNYNAAAPPFSDKSQMMEYAHTHSAKLTEHLTHGVECDPRKNASISNVLYTRANPVVTNQDIKTYDLGLFQLAIANAPSNYAGLPVGEMWVSYKCVLRKPKLFVSRGLEIDSDIFYTSSQIDTLTPSTWAGAKGSTAFLLGQQNNIGCLFQPGVSYSYSGETTPVQTAASGNGLSIVIPAAYSGPLKIMFVIKLATISAAPTVTYGGNVSPLNDIYDTKSPSSYYNIFNATNNILGVIDIFVRPATAVAYNAALKFDNTTNYSGGNNVINIGSFTGTTPTNVWVTVSQYNTLGGLANINTSNSRILFVNSNNQITTPS